ncbi:MAG: GNAT family N-acetyltransferase [Eubacterium sp.]|nr:GNAT family N-acetyltransferase [Eubacterium sp.]
MKTELLSKRYDVTVLQKSDIPDVMSLCLGNPQYYRYCPPFVTEESIASDMKALPDGKTAEDKFYLGFWDGKTLVAVLDLIIKYPNTKTAFIGFFMVNAQVQGKGIGSALVDDIEEYLKEAFSYIRLGYVKGNKQSESFWVKNGFKPTGVTVKGEEYEMVVMEKEI